MNNTESTNGFKALFFRKLIEMKAIFWCCLAIGALSAFTCAREFQKSRMPRFKLFKVAEITLRQNGWSEIKTDPARLLASDDYAQGWWDIKFEPEPGSRETQLQREDENTRRVDRIHVQMKLDGTNPIILHE